MDDDFVMSVRAVVKGQFVAESGDSIFLQVPAGALPSPAQKVPAKAWYKAVQTAGEWKNAAGEARGDILFVVHGYNMSEVEVMDRHRRIKSGLTELGFKGVVVSFDWPSENNALAYWNDRHRAKETALKLVSDGISYLSAIQTPDCPVNVHLLGHSTGVYVIREAFDDADDSQLKNSGWTVSQVVFAAGDVSAGSMSTGDSGAKSVYNHCVRLTNYANRYDSILDISNVKRVGVAPRVGRIGLPGDVPGKAVNVDCGDYYAQLDSDSKIEKADQPGGRAGAKSHSWFFGNKVFNLDLFNTIIGIERNAMPTRAPFTDGRLRLKRPSE